MNTTITIYIKSGWQNSLFQKEDERNKIIVNKKELDSMSFIYYNRITYR